ncbi:MAG: ABC transporter ATP-binding protein [Lachnospiraceae bacterium]|nr:ABC transporter ATP-binding protein [Lachnospiraceae bacterium]
MILELKNIYKTYIQGSMEVPVLKDINLSVEEGEYVAIMGPSGSGKSTLMNIIGCLDKATEGTYILDGQEINDYKDKELSFVRNKKIGFVFQTFNLLPRQTALDNVGLPLQYAKVALRERKKRCEEVLDMVGLSDRMNFKPTQLSGGQKQRVAIARAMVNQPKILLADEPTGALDSKSGLQVMDLFDKLHENGVTIIMITHSEEIAKRADRIIKIIDGELICEGESAQAWTEEEALYDYGQEVDSNE